VGQDGEVKGTEVKSLGENESFRFTKFPPEFVGVAEIFCSEDCTATGTWNFGLSGESDFAVGISPIDPSEASDRWASPLPVISEGTSVGLAVQNVGTRPTTCSVFYYAPDGEQIPAVDGFPPNQGIPVGGQTSLFSPNVPDEVPPQFIGPDGFEGSLRLRCFEPVIAIIVIQDRVNGFPTPIALEPYSISD
jgi:hypothetical protein